MKKILTIALTMTASFCMAQHVMKVENKNEKVDRYQTKEVSHVGLKVDDKKTLTVQGTEGTTRKYDLSQVRRFFVDPIEGDDSLFQSADGMRQYLTNLYHMQRHGLPFSYQKQPYSQNAYDGAVLDGLTDCYQMHWPQSSLFTNYYIDALDASEDALISYSHDWVWETVSMAWRLIESIDRVKELPTDERQRMVAEAKCLIACRYFDLLPYYGGLPIVKNSNSGTNETCAKPRATFAETVDFMVSLLDEAIPVLPWAKDESRAESDGFNRYWTAAGAKALKAKILLLAASPLFNNEYSYYDGTTEAEKQHLVWYGNYDAARWQRALEACRDFFLSNGESDPTSATLGTNGTYHLLMPTTHSADAYRQAYRMGYIDVKSPEVIHSNRAYSTYRGGEEPAVYGNGGREEALFGTQSSYSWWSFVGMGRNSYLPTEEYVEMFPWSSGEPFKWDEESDAPAAPTSDILNNKNQVLDVQGQLFFCPATSIGRVRKPKYPVRDPRLYENAIVNGQQKTLDWDKGESGGDIYELWVGGEDAQFTVANENGDIVEQFTSQYADGYGVIKYYLGEEYRRKPLHFVVLGYNEMLLMYAECLAQTGDLTAALNCINRVRARVGLANIENFDATLTTDKDKLLEEILRERACELGMSGNRYFDQCRYKRADWMTRPLHGLLVYRLMKNSHGEWVRVLRPYVGYDKNTGVYEPDHFEYKRFELINRRTFWDYDPSSLKVRRMFLWPLPASELEKNYGLVQNPGW